MSGWIGRNVFSGVRSRIGRQSDDSGDDMVFFSELFFLFSKDSRPHKQLRAPSIRIDSLKNPCRSSKVVVIIQ